MEWAVLAVLSFGMPLAVLPAIKAMFIKQQGLILRQI
jgi:chromate transport protein ChrA